MHQAMAIQAHAIELEGGKAVSTPLSFFVCILLFARALSGGLGCEWRSPIGAEPDAPLINLKWTGGPTATW